MAMTRTKDAATQTETPWGAMARTKDVATQTETPWGTKPTKEEALSKLEEPIFKDESLEFQELAPRRTQSQNRKVKWRRAAERG